MKVLIILVTFFLLLNQSLYSYDRYLFLDSNQLQMGGTIVANTKGSTAIIHNPALLLESTDDRIFEISLDVAQDNQSTYYSNIKIYNPLVSFFGNRLHFGFYTDIYSSTFVQKQPVDTLINFQFNRHRLYTLGYATNIKFFGDNQVGFALQYHLIDTIYDKFTGEDGVMFSLSENNIALNLLSMYYGVSYNDVEYDGFDIVLGYVKPIKKLDKYDFKLAAAISNIFGEFKGKKNILSEYYSDQVILPLSARVGMSFIIPLFSKIFAYSESLITIDYDVLSDFEDFSRNLYIGYSQVIIPLNIEYSLGYIQNKIVYGGRYQFKLFKKSTADLNIAKVMSPVLNNGPFEDGYKLSFKLYFK